MKQVGEISGPPLSNGWVQSLLLFSQVQFQDFFFSLYHNGLLKFSEKMLAQRDIFKTRQDVWSDAQMPKCPNTARNKQGIKLSYHMMEKQE